MEKTGEQSDRSFEIQLIFEEENIKHGKI